MSNIDMNSNHNAWNSFYLFSNYILYSVSLLHFLETFKDLELYLHIFPPRLRHPTLAVIGCVTTLGGQPPVFELQTRLAARVFKGHVSLPDEFTMIKDIHRRKDTLFKTFGKHRLFVSIRIQVYIIKYIVAIVRSIFHAEDSRA